jgi:hypothetical protein
LVHLGLAAAVIFAAASAMAIEPVRYRASRNACSQRCTCLGQGYCERCVDKIAEIGYFNCQCRGSYKFPVPPLYTYHWPGMYSQKTITQYNSPYRFPPLQLPSETGLEGPISAAPDEGDSSFLGPIRIKSVSKTGGSSRDARPERISQKLRRVYELD